MACSARPRRRDNRAAAVVSTRTFEPRRRRRRRACTRQFIGARGIRIDCCCMSGCPRSRRCATRAEGRRGSRERDRAGRTGRVIRSTVCTRPSQRASLDDALRVLEARGWTPSLEPGSPRTMTRYGQPNGCQKSRAVVGMPLRANRSLLGVDAGNGFRRPLDARCGSRASTARRGVVAVRQRAGTGLFARGARLQRSCATVRSCSGSCWRKSQCNIAVRLRCSICCRRRRTAR